MVDNVVFEHPSLLFLQKKCQAISYIVAFNDAVYLELYKRRDRLPHQEENSLINALQNGNVVGFDGEFEHGCG